MPWQHYILIGELMLSALIAGYKIFNTDKLEHTLTAKAAYPWAAIEAIMVGLLIWGADHFAWQYAIVGVWFTFDCFVNLFHVGHVTDLAKKREHPTGFALFIAVQLVVMVTLLYTGA